MRRPSAAMLVALLALFVALGGPAQAKHLINGKDIRRGTVASAQIKDRSLGERDLSPTAIRALQVTPDASLGANKLIPGAIGGLQLADGSVSGTDLADGTVTPADIADGAIGSGKLADSSVTGAKIADGTLTTADIARFSGAFRILAEDLGVIKAHECWSREPRGLAPEAAGADISQDALLVVPRASFNGQTFSFNYRTSAPNPNDPGAASRFVLTLCNRTDTDATPPSVAFSYIIFDLP
ncbi:MAG TPA: hypothetical protein VI300_27630 [Solirubrobacter sp.]